MRFSGTILGGIAICSALVVAAPLESPLFKRDVFGVKVVNCDVSKVSVPASQGATDLPPPTAGLKLLRIGLGVGTQNYSCAASTGPPVSNGAKASLYDVSCLVTQKPDDAFGLPGLSLGNPTMFQSMLATVKSKFPGEAVFFADHFFAPDFATPTFVDFISKKVFSGKKDAGITAPTFSINTQVNQGNGVVDWLKLKDGGASNGYKEVYRVYTAGGKAPASCDSQPATILIPYGALYYFYGPA